MLTTYSFPAGPFFARWAPSLCICFGPNFATASSVSKDSHVRGLDFSSTAYTLAIILISLSLVTLICILSSIFMVKSIFKPLIRPFKPSLKPYHNNAAFLKTPMLLFPIIATCLYFEISRSDSLIQLTIKLAYYAFASDAPEYFQVITSSTRATSIAWIGLSKLFSVSQLPSNLAKSSLGAFPATITLALVPSLVLDKFIPTTPFTFTLVAISLSSGAALVFFSSLNQRVVILDTKEATLATREARCAKFSASLKSTCEVLALDKAKARNAQATLEADRTALEDQKFNLESTSLEHHLIVAQEHARLNLKMEELEAMWAEIKQARLTLDERANNLRVNEKLLEAGQLELSVRCDALEKERLRFLEQMSYASRHVRSLKREVAPRSPQHGARNTISPKIGIQPKRNSTEQASVTAQTPPPTFLDATFDSANVSPDKTLRLEDIITPMDDLCTITPPPTYLDISFADERRDLIN